ncbi:MAG: glycine cleavage system aminomethyltransferase GcvT [Candidatus Omnitrophica bacterium]|nr:glycine cleavage system aminomethyltransferase GcvT [Candidatus Omnitrophota bacterium]
MADLKSEVKRLPLHRFYEQAGARFIQFAGWEVPVYFTSIIDEHDAVRKNVGLFDISHMGEFRVRGKEARKFLDWLVTNKVSKLTPLKAVYSPMLNEQAGIIDDLIVYEISEEHFLVIVNAGNVAVDFAWMKSKAPAGVEVINLSPERGIQAVQGPNSSKVIEKVFGTKAAGISSFTILPVPFEGREVIVSRTGYTGEDGFEIFYDCGIAEPLYLALKKAGESLGMKPIGFGARDTLRLEARLLLHGHDMNATITPLECGLTWTIDFEKKDFIGKARLDREKQSGVVRKLVGFEMVDRGLAREHYKVCSKGKEIGEVTSGSFAPSLKKNIGLALIQSDFAKEGNEIEIMIRDQAQKAKIVKTPFYKKGQ